MTTRTIPRERLSAALPPVTTSQTLLALVPVTSDVTWAAETAWSIARAAATGGRQVILVDLCFDEPVLHRPVGDSVDNGIVDAFEYGVSLSYVSRAHLDRTLFFIPTGTDAGDPARVLASTRWSRLSRGLGASGALLLLYLTPSSLAQLGATADGIVVLAPQGFDPESTPIPKLDAVVESGVPLLAVVSEGSTQPGADAAATPVAATTLGAAEPRRAGEGHAHVRPRRIGRWIVAGAVPIAAVALFVLLRNPGQADTPSTPPDTAAAPPAAVVQEPEPQPEPPAPELPPAPDALPFATATPFVVQVAAYDVADQARARADRLRSANRDAFVTVLALGSLGTWYRVYLGPYASAQQAVDARAALWAARSVRRGEGMVRRAPFSLEVPLELRADVEGAGLVTYVVEDRLLVGAFESPQQTTVTEQILTQAGVPFTLVERTESRP